MRKFLTFAFLLYGAVLFRILFLGREAELSLSVPEYFFLYANGCPGRTLFRYLSFFLAKRDRESFFLAFFNIGGNFLLFLPMGFFLPALFFRMRKPGRALGAVFPAVVLAELFQGVLRIGVPDIDDLLLNLSGAYAGVRLAEIFGFCGNCCHRKPGLRIHFEKK